LGVQRWGDWRRGDQNGRDPVFGPILPDQGVNGLGDLIRACPFVVGTDRDGFDQYDRRSACQNQHHETADGLWRGGRSVGGLQWGGLEIRVPVLLLQSATWTVWVAWLLQEKAQHHDAGQRGVWMRDDLDDWNRASSTASSRTDDRHQDGDSWQIRQSADLDGEVLIQTEPGAVRSGTGVRQIERVDVRYGRPSSMPDGLRRTAVGQNAAVRIAAGQVAAGQGAVSRTGRDRFQRVPAWDGNLPLPGAPSG
jgi:hypothetical protein